jgi:hypothetical protein
MFWMAHQAAPLFPLEPPLHKAFLSFLNNNADDSVDFWCGVPDPAVTQAADDIEKLVLAAIKVKPSRPRYWSSV